MKDFKEILKQAEITVTDEQLATVETEIKENYSATIEIFARLQLDTILWNVPLQASTRARKKHSKITSENYHNYIDTLRVECKKKLDLLGIIDKNVGRLVIMQKRCIHMEFLTKWKQNAILW